MSHTPTAGEAVLTDYRKFEHIKKGLVEQMDDCARRGMEGEDNNDEFMDLKRKQSMASQAEMSMLKLHFKPMQKVLDER
jgi:uncharacterized membrane protein (DUF106 family)